jgi:hypothetical protein
VTLLSALLPSWKLALDPVAVLEAGARRRRQVTQGPAMLEAVWIRLA